ncbi:MAG: alpha-glucan family phosphorylase [Acidimicrobiales bacterium]
MNTTDSSALRASLRAIASNYAWTWNVQLAGVLHDALGADWTGHGHPLQAIDAINDAALSSLAADAAFVERASDAAAVVAGLEAASVSTGTATAPTPVEVAYISAEFGVSETLPQYSGGLGILAGDHLKAASDLGVGLVAVGLFYANGYFDQSVDASGQVVAYQTYQPQDLGLTDTGARVSVDTPRGPINASVWLARIGNIRLYLLDTRVAGNADWATAVTDRLYGGDQQKRIDQEMLLGIGGLRALAAVGLVPQMVHLNEGHAGFGLLELLADEMAAGRTFPDAQAAVRARTLFTTHTPVPAGIDRFPRSLLAPYLETWCRRTGVALDTIWAEGDLPSDHAPDEFNMAAFCLGHAARTNGVSALHGEVSQELFGSRPEGAAITSVTNGVHARTWTTPATQAFLDGALGHDSGWDLGHADAWRAATTIGDDEIISLRAALRRQLIEHLNANYGLTLDPNILTIGFARRFATYKRAALLLRHPERLAALLGDDEHPVQFVFAGKAHPADLPGQAVLRSVLDYGNTPEANGRFAFAPGYDMALAGLLYGGCDVWLNNPVRPQEACGTSGEKSALNGGLNCSILDGWWAEWYDAANGWAIPTSDLDDPEARDDAEATAMHDLLATEVVPSFYADGERRPSAEWLDRIRAGWTILGPKVTAGRMVADYRDQLYRPIITSQSAH